MNNKDGTGYYYRVVRVSITFGEIQTRVYEMTRDQMRKEGPLFTINEWNRAKVGGEWVYKYALISHSEFEAETARSS